MVGALLALTGKLQLGNYKTLPPLRGTDSASGAHLPLLPARGNRLRF